jgi:hypothetical protein
MAKAKKPVRDGGNYVTVQNSGLEVWIYDDANRAEIAKARSGDEGAGGMPPDFEAKTREGLIVGYSLMQDDDVGVEVHVGKPFTEKELSVARWLEPQVAFLRVPSGKLCVESNDASRVGPEEPGQTGATVTVPKGDYRLTLYRVDYEALSREELEWKGAQEIILLTPGGSASEAPPYLLPYEERRDLTWVGKYTINGKKADAMIWFPDRWDTFVVNLDSAAIARLGLKPGAYLRTTVPATGLTLVTTFAANWEDARRLPPPDGVDVTEFGYASLSPLQEWNGAEALFCRRDDGKTIVEDKNITVWLPGTVEVLDAKPRQTKETTRRFVDAKLKDKAYFDPGFLGLILSDVLPGVGDLDELLLPDAVARLDKAFDDFILIPLVDVSWEEEAPDDQRVELTARLYTGRDDCFAMVMAQEANIHIAFMTERADGQWILTGLLDDLERAIRNAESRRPAGAKTTVTCVDADMRETFEAHREAIKGVEIKNAPTTRAGVEGALQRFLATAFA